LYGKLKAKVKCVIEITSFHLNGIAVWLLLMLMQNGRENEDAYIFNRILHQTPG